MSESEIVKKTRLALGGRSDIRLWRQNTGVGLSMDGSRVQRFGVVGGADLSGIAAGGIRLELEGKDQRGRQSAQQKAFQTMIERFGGVYIVFRSAEEAEAEVNRLLWARYNALRAELEQLIANLEGRLE